MGCGKERWGGWGCGVGWAGVGGLHSFFTAPINNDKRHGRYELMNCTAQGFFRAGDYIAGCAEPIYGVTRTGENVQGNSEACFAV